MEDAEETSDEILARLTSAVQRELAAVIALKARKSALEQDEEGGDKHTAGTDAEGAPESQAGVMCKLHERDDLGRIELVQKLARENCQLLHTDKKGHEKSDHPEDEASTIQVKEQDRDVLVLKKVPGCGPAPASGSADSDWR
ncbi:rap guanine nucleotide exchange factor 5-like [Tenrec ecaudatus]|uniref:rap guanine nucleotide exchange factor 5-like n=1 Tax=Tenrec ecaudatus TaxID=94439 RepID=UPI003F5ACB11